MQLGSISARIDNSLMETRIFGPADIKLFTGRHRWSLEKLTRSCAVPTYAARTGGGVAFACLETELPLDCSCK